jgi:hypothetical protein
MSRESDLARIKAKATLFVMVVGFFIDLIERTIEGEFE